MNYPDRIFATGKSGSNGIECLDFRDFDEDVEYIKLSIMESKLEEKDKEIAILKQSNKEKFPTLNDVFKSLGKPVNRRSYETD